MIVQRILMIVVKETDNGWEAKCRQLPNLYIFGKDYDIVRTTALEQARLMQPGIRFKCKPVTREYVKAVKPEKPNPPKESNIGIFNSSVAKLLNAKRLIIKHYKGDKIYVLDNKIGATIPQIIQAAGWDL